jgi:hypothetical protein
VKNELVVTFIAGSLKSVSREDAGGGETPYAGEVQARLQKIESVIWSVVW